MKKIPIACLSLFLIASLSLACSRKESAGGTKVPRDTTAVVTIVEEKDSVISQTADSVEEGIEYGGSLVAEDDNIKVFLNHGLPEKYAKFGDDITAKDESYFVKYIDNVPQDTMVIRGPYNSLTGKKNFCMITVGNETVKFKISNTFQKFLDVRFAGVLPGCKFFCLSKHYQLNSKSFPTDFQTNIAIRDDAPQYIRDFINKMIRDQVAGYFGDYSDDETSYPDIPLFDLGTGDFSKMSRYYYNQFCRLYKKEYGTSRDPDDPPFGPCYSYQYYAYPVWENSDSSLVTWKFYNYCYMGGAHGGETEYFLTFDNHTGRILGANDFYGKQGFRKAIDTLTRQLNAYHDREPYGEYSFAADLDEASNIIAVESKILNETIGNKIYPRPSLTRHGMIFSYQTYEKGSNADGVLHFTQPFDKDFKLSNDK